MLFLPASDSLFLVSAPWAFHPSERVFAKNNSASISAVNIPLRQVRSRLILAGFMPCPLRVMLYWLISALVIWNAQGSSVIRVKISILPKLDFPCSSCLPFKSHQTFVNSDRCRLSVGLASHSLSWWLYWVCFSKLQPHFSCQISCGCAFRCALQVWCPLRIDHHRVS